MADETQGTTVDPDAVREEIEHTRARMSETIDEIEDVLVRKKEKIQDRLDVLAPVRERPLPSLGIVFGAGLLLGFLTGGDDDGPDRDGRRYNGLPADAHARAELWERRARRLLRIAREQEEELAELDASRAYAADGEWDENDDDDRDSSAEESGFAALDRVRDEMSDRVAGFVTGALRDVFGGGRSS